MSSLSLTSASYSRRQLPMIALRPPFSERKRRSSTSEAVREATSTVRNSFGLPRCRSTRITSTYPECGWPPCDQCAHRSPRPGASLKQSRYWLRYKKDRLRVERPSVSVIVTDSVP